MFKRILSTVLCAVLLISTLFGTYAFAAENEIISGNIGSNISWSLNTNTGILIFSGNGKIPDYTYSGGRSSADWGAYNNIIRAVVIQDGITAIGNYAFYGMSELTHVTVPETVTAIGENVFQYCTSLKNITLPDTVANLGQYAFSDCTALESITLSGALTLLSGSLFASCSALKAIEIPDSVKTIDYSAFAYCTSLESVTIPNSVTVIKGGAFSHCSSLEEVTVPDTVTNLYSTVFEYCTSLKKVTLPDTLTSINNGLFKGCSALESIELPAELTTISESAFEGCSALSSVTFPETLTKIKRAAFSGCRSLESVVFPASIATVEYDAFRSCTKLAEISVPKTGVYFDGNPFLYSAYHKDEANWKDDVFYVETYLIEAKESVAGTYYVREGTTTVLSYAFDGCGDLTEVILPNSVVSIGSVVFNGCYSLESITIPDTVTSIGIDVFCTKVTVRCYKNTVAHDYAIEYRLNCEFICDCSFTSFTLDNNGTCITDSTETAFCDMGCGRKYTRIAEGTMGDHSYGEYIFNNDATCGADGTESAGCKFCDATDTRTAADTKTNDHSYGDWVTVTEPTEEKEGTEERTCPVCGASEQREIPKSETEAPEFNDIKETAWFYGSVTYVVKKGYMKGMSETEFSPNTDITREQFVLILANIANVDTDEYKYTETVFTDIAIGKWYSGAVAWAVKEGYISGMTATTFGRGLPIQRAALARMLYNYASKNNISTEGRADLSDFADAKDFEKSGNAWMVEPVQWAVNAGIISGMNVNGKLSVNPKGNATRAQATVMLMKFDEFVEA